MLDMYKPWNRGPHIEMAGSDDAELSAIIQLLSMCSDTVNSGTRSMLGSGMPAHGCTTLCFRLQEDGAVPGLGRSMLF